ncbi:MAG: aldehyde dehydrogenase family protein [Opitutaceae bacterium]
MMKTNHGWTQTYANAEASKAEDHAPGGRARPCARVTENLHSFIAGEAVRDGAQLEVRNPWNGVAIGSVTTIDRAQLEKAIGSHLAAGPALTRFERGTILHRARAMLEERREEFARLITRESGLALRETRYEVGRACDVLAFSAMEALRDDGRIYSCDIAPGGKARKIFTTREPLALVAAITPFNHPLNQVAHKIAPAIAAGAPTILKPSEKTPLTALKFAELLYEAGLPGWMLSVVLGGLDEIVRPLIRDERVELVTFTGSAIVGKEIAATAGYKKLCLELGGHSPLLVLEDADLDLAAKLACEGCFRNSGQRCTAVRRLLVHEGVLAEFTERFVSKARDYITGDPEDESTIVGTVIDELAARALEAAVREAEAAGARVIHGGKRRGALIEPTILADVPRTAAIATRECFGPLAPVFTVRDLDDAIALANATPYGLSSGVVTQSLEAATRAIKGIRAGTVNINEIPGYRLELSPFGGVKDSGLGIKEGVVMGDFNAVSPQDAGMYDDGRLVLYRTAAQVKHPIHDDLVEGKLDFEVINRVLSAGFADAVRLDHEGDLFSQPTRRFMKEEGRNVPRRVDYIFVSEDLQDEVVGARIVKDEFTDMHSDHYPVLLELRP